MKEVGLVVSLDKNYAQVKVDKKDECSKCGMCLFPKNADSIELRAENSFGAKVGDTAIIETAKDTKLLGAVLVFLIPLLLIGFSAIITYIFIKKEIWTLILSVIFIFLWYNILAAIDKKLKNSQRFCAKVVAVLNKENNENE